ncbi:MAG: hypothetical protein HYU36_24220 [Planctomycetes bacterium]|nr:hypothetical protein [Planctomycetota bacterium]
MKKRDLEAKSCEVCGKPFERKRFPSGRLETPAAFLKRRFCGMVCYATWYRDHPDIRPQKPTWEAPQADAQKPEARPIVNHFASRPNAGRNLDARKPGPRPIVNPGTVAWAGDHLLLYLKMPDVEQETTLISFYHTVYSPAGNGNTALVLCDRDGDGWSPDDLRAIYTDNEGLTAWVRETLVRKPDHPIRQTDLPVLSATFEAQGHIGRQWTEILRAAGMEIRMSWWNFETPIYVEGPRGSFGPDYDIFSLLCPSRAATVKINGRKAVGSPYPREIWRATTGRALSSTLIAVAEVLIDC